MDNQLLIKACKKGDSGAQKALYNKYAPLLFAIARRYVKVTEDAEEVFSEAMFKILTKINTYTGKGNFEGWMKRIVVNESLMHLRKNSNMQLTIQVDDLQIETPSKVVDRMSRDEILELIDDLPPGYRTVFNLYVIEGYKHREIAEMLGISINTSKSQLILAKKRLREELKKKTLINLNPNRDGRISIMA